MERMTVTAHGIWLRNYEEPTEIFSCSVCKDELVCIEGTPVDNGWKFCPYCGAAMDGMEDYGEEDYDGEVKKDD